MSEIEWVRYIKEPSPRHRVSLRDGSQLTVFLDPREIQVLAGIVGQIDLRATEIGAMWGAEVELPKECEQEDGVTEIVEIPKEMSSRACLLSGSNLIAGDLGGEDLHVLTGATVTRVRVSDIVRIGRSGDGGELAPVFEIELAAGDKITGMLQERSLEIRSGERSWIVPVQHFLAFSRLVDDGGEAEPQPEPEAAARPVGGRAHAVGRVASRRVVPGSPAGQNPTGVGGDQ